MERQRMDKMYKHPYQSTTAISTVFLHVTKACNLECGYCYFSARRPMPDELSTDELSSVWPDLVRLAPRKVVFTGGEPLLRGDIVELLSTLRNADSDRRVLRCLNTNGHLVTSPLARELVGLADEVRVSVDALATRNDALRGKGNYDAAMHALAVFQDAGFEPKALVTVTSASIDDLEELLSLLFARGITRINLNTFRAVGRGAGQPALTPDPVRISVALSQAWSRAFPDRPAPAEPGNQPQCTCGVGRYLNILPNGDVFPCHVLTDRRFHCGNLRRQSLLEICSGEGIVGRLASLDFADLSHEDSRLEELTRQGSCLGDVHAKNRSLPVWRRLTHIEGL